jgi:hypothetical protein
VKSIFFIDNSPSTKYNLIKAIGIYDNLFGRAPKFRYVPSLHVFMGKDKILDFTWTITWHFPSLGWDPCVPNVHGLEHLSCPSDYTLLMF